MSATKSGCGTGFGFAVGAIIAVSLLLFFMCGGCAMLGIGTTGVIIEESDRRAIEQMDREGDGAEQPPIEAPLPEAE